MLVLGSLKRANAKSNQQNLGTIKSSNLCTEIVEFDARVFLKLGKELLLKGKVSNYQLRKKKFKNYDGLMNTP
jgi:hypothetical protein